ncbi:glycosyltransferase [Lentzea sp. NPDC004789]
MAKGNVNPTPSPTPNTNPAPNPTPSPSSTGTGGSNGPTGNTGFSMNDSSMQGLQSKAGDLGSRLSSISSGLRGLNFSGNALGPIGLFAVPALNASNDHAVSQADKGAKAFTDVQAGLKATHETAVSTDTNQKTTFNSFDTSTNAKPPPGAANTTLGNNPQGGPKVSGPGSINGGGTSTLGNNPQGGPNVSQAPNIKGGGGFTGGGAKGPGGPSVTTAPDIKGGTGPAGGGGVKTPGGPSVGTVPTVKSGGGPVSTGGVNTPGGPSIGATPNVKGGTGPVAGGGSKGVGGPSVGVTPPSVKGGTTPAAGGGAKGVGGPGLTTPPVIGGATPGSAKPGTTPGGKGGATPSALGGTPGGKGGAIPSVPGGTPGGKGGTPPTSAPGPKPGVTPPGPQSAVTSPSTGGPRGATPGTPGAPGMAPPSAPGALGAQGGERGGSKFGAGGGKGVFDAPKPGTPDSTITKAPPGSSSTPPPKPGTPGTPGSPTPGATSPKPGAPGTPGPASSPTPGATSPKPGVPGTPTPGPQAAVTTPTQSGSRGGITPGTTPPPAANPGATPPPAAPGGANPGATTSERGGNKFGSGLGAGKGVFDAPKPPTPDNTISKAPGTSPSTPPPAPKPTPFTPPPASVPPASSSPNTNTPNTNTPAANAPGTNSPGTNAPGPNTRGPNPPGTNPPGTNAPSPRPDATPSPQPPRADTAPPVQTRPAPSTNVPPANAPSPNAPSPRPDVTPSPQSPKPDTVPPVQTRPAPNVPPVNTPSPNTPPVNTPGPNTPPVNTPGPNVPPANVPSPNTPPVNAPSPAPNPNTNVPPVNTPNPSPNPNVNAPSARPETNVPPPNPNTPSPKPAPNTPPANPNTPPVNAPTNVPPANTPNPSTPAPHTRPAPDADTNVPTKTPAPDLVVAPPAVQTRPAPPPATTSTSPNPAPSVVPRSHPAAGPFQAQPRSGGGRTRAKLKKWLGIDFVKGLFNKPSATPAPAPATNTSPNTDTSTNTTPQDPWVGMLGAKANPSGMDVDTLKGHVDAAVNDGKPGRARVLINRITDPGKKAELQQHYDTAVGNKGDAGKVEVPKELHFAWFGTTPSPGAVQGMKEWGAKVGENNGKNADPKQQWKATLWTDDSVHSWDPAVVQELRDAGIDIKTDTPQLVNDLSNDVQSRTDTSTTINDVYNAAQHPDAKAYNLAADIARYAVLAKNGGVYVDVDIRPGAVSLDNIGDMKMHPTDLPLIGPRIRDQQSLDRTLQGHDVAPGTELQTAENIQYGKGELNNNFIVAPPNNDFIKSFADIIPQKFDSLQNDLNSTRAELKAQAPDISGPNVFVDSALPAVRPKMGLIGMHTMKPDNLDLKLEPGLSWAPPQVPLIQKTDFGALFDPDLKNKWSGLEWITPESETQLDNDTTPAADRSNPGNDSSRPGNESRQAPPPSPPAPPAPPAPPTSPAPNSDTGTDAPKTIKSGGAPPKMDPKTWDSHQGKDVLTDQTWRHDPAKTADWFAPNNPADPSTWADRRADAHVGKVDTEVADVKTNSTPSDVDSYKGIVKYDLRRIETSPGNFVQEYTVKMHIDPGANPDPKVVEDLKQNVTQGVDKLLNQGYRMPSGDQFHVNVEFTENKAEAHAEIKVGDQDTNTDQNNWKPGESPEILAHETLHYLGVPDEYKDSSRVFQQHDTNSGVHQNDGGMMGADIRDLKTDPGLRPRHLWLIENTANNQTVVHDTRLDAPGPATVPPPAPAPNTNTGPDTNTDTRSRQAPQTTQNANLGDKRSRDDSPDSGHESNTDVDDRPTKRQNQADAPTGGPSNVDPGTPMDVDSDTQAENNADDNPENNTDSQTDALADQMSNMSLGDIDATTKYNPAFAKLGEGKIDLPTKDNYLGKLKESVENNKPPSFVVNMIVGHGDLGRIDSVIESITKDAGPHKDNMVFVVGVNGKAADTPAMIAAINDANSKISGRTEPIALVQLPPTPDKGGFPYGDMRNNTMNSSANRFAVGAMVGKGTHPYLSIQDFDTGSRQVPSGKDIFNHVADSLNTEAGPVRPLMYTGGYRVGDPEALVKDVKTRIENQRKNDLPKLSGKERDALKNALDKAEAEVKKPDFPARFEQAMKNDMDARVRQGDTHPLLPYGPEPNLFIDAVVPLVDPDVKFSKADAEYNGLGKSMNEFAGKELVDIHTNLLPKPELNQDLKEAKAKLEADIAAQGGKPSGAQTGVLQSIDNNIEVNQERAKDTPGYEAAANQIAVDSAITVDSQTNRNPLRGETFSNDFVDGAVATDLSRLALGFAKTEGKSWPQSHVDLKNVPNRMFGADNPKDAKAAKAGIGFADIRKEFQGKDPAAREPAQIHGEQYNPVTGRNEPIGTNWQPSDADVKKLGGTDKNTLNQAVSTPLPDGKGVMGIDPQTTPAPAPANADGDVQMQDAGTDANTAVDDKHHKIASALNIALSDNNSNVQRTFGALQHQILPIAGNPRPDGLFAAVNAELGKGGTNVAPATDLRQQTVQKAATASPGITTQIANFRQQHGIENGHLVNAFAEPGPTPQVQIPDSYKGNGGDTAVDNTDTPGQDLDPAERQAENNAAQDAKDADNKVAAKAEELAGRVLATELKRPIVVHHPGGGTTKLDPFVEPPKPGSKTTPKPPKWGAPIHLNAEPRPNGKTSYSPHTPPNEAGPSTDRSRPAPADSNTDTRQTRPAPPKPTPNPVVPMTTLAPQPVGQVPDTNLPSFFQDNKALGSITPTDVRGADAVVGEIQGIKPDDAARIKNALENDFETFLGNGRNFQVKIGNAWFEANVRAEMHADATTAVKDAPDTKVDKNFQAAAASTTTNTVATSNDIGGSATAGTAVGPYGSLGGKAALATPAVSQATTNTTTEQRAIKSDGGSKQVTVPVSYEITVTDAAGNPRQFATLSTGPDVTLQVPADLSTIVDSGKTSDVVTPADANWGAKVENAVPEAVVVQDAGKAFSDVAEKLHPSITKVGAPGREVLQNFLSPTSIRNNLPAMLGGFVTSPDLVSPHAGKGAAVQMTATLKDAKLVGTHDKAALEVKDTSAWGSSVSASTKTGFDVTAGFGGNVGVPGKAGGTVGATVTYSARTAEGVSAGSSSNRKTGIGVKNETGLYEVTAEVEVRTPAGESVKIPITTHVRMGLHEAGAVGLPTPDGTRNTITDPATADTKYLPPYLADTLAAGNAKVGEFTPAAKVQGQVESALRDLPGMSKLLPQWNNPDANPRSSKGQGFADVAEQLANQRKLTANLSPAALKANMDSLLGPGVQVQLKNSGKTTNTYVNVTVKAKLTNPKHLGQADARPVSDSTTTGPKLDAGTTTTKGWTGGVQGRANIPVKTGVASLTPSPQAGVSYSHSWADKTSAGPAVSGTSSNPGSANAQVFQQDVEFEVEITSFTRPRTWVRNIVPGAPGFHSPDVKTVAKTGAGLDKIDGKVNLWVSDGSTLDHDPGNGFKPGDPQPTKLDNSPTVKDLLNPKEARPKSPEFLHVEAVANTTALRDQAIDALNRAANGDSALTTPGTASRAQIDKMFTPENIKANLQRLIETGVQEQGLKYDRRVTDRTGAIGMSVKLGEAKIVSISDTTGADNSVSGGYKAGESSTTSRSVDLTAGINVPVRPNVTPPPAGTPSKTSGSGGAAVTGKITPWSDSRTESSEIGGNVDRGRTTPGDARTVLVQIDAEFTIVGESRAGNFVHGGTPHAEGVTVNMPKSVFVRVSEDVARQLGALPTVAPNVPKPDFPQMAPPATVAPGEPGALGLSNVESVPDLSGVVNDLTNQLSVNTKKFGSDSLIPDSVLKDSMSNLQRIVDLNSPTSVKAMIDSALDGGVPLLVHQPGTFGKDSYQVTLRAKAGEPKFDQVVNDGVDMTHNSGGSRKESTGQGRGSGWGVGLRVPGLAAPGSANPNVSGTAGAAVGANIGGSKSSSVTTSTNEAFSHTRTASGPAARYNVPIEFELVVEKGSKVVAEARSTEQDMVVRTHADNQKVSQPTSGRGNPQPYMSAASRRGSEFGTPEATFAFQQDSRASQLPPTASVENLRGAKDLRDAAVKALTEAGAGKGLTGKGTGALNSLFSTLSPENLQPHLPSMLSGPLDVPGLKEAALTFGQDADVKVYAKLVNPQLGALSDSVKIENPLVTRTAETSSEAKASETADVSAGLAQGSAAVKQGAPADTVNVGTGGVEVRHAGEDSAAVSGGPAQAEGGNIKPKDTPRSGLVQFDVEYRVVATIGGKTGVVDLTVPGSAGVRMPGSEVETLLKHDFGDSLKDAQTEVKKAADDWRTAEKDVETARHEAQDAINSAAAVLARTDQPLSEAATALNSAIDAHLDASAKLPALEAAASATQADVARTRATIQELNPQITSLSQDALATKDALDDAQINGAPQPELDRLGQEADAAHAALTDAQQQLTEAHADLDAQRKAAADARAALQAQQQVVAQADAARADAEAAHQRLADERAASEKTIKDAETKLDEARRTADAKQQAWWDAKAKVDREVDAFNTAAQAPPPVPPKDTPAGVDERPLPPTPPADTTADVDERPLPPTPPADTTPDVDTTNTSESSGRKWSPALPSIPESPEAEAGDRDSEAETRSSRPAPRPAPEVRTRPAPQPPSAPAVPSTSADTGTARTTTDTTDTDTTGTRADTGTAHTADTNADHTTDTTQADTNSPTELDHQLADLTSDAMTTASPMAKLVEMKLQSDPRKFVQSEAGLHLLHASVVLDTRTDEIAAMIRQHGIGEVAKTFNKAFERPIIETVQLEQFADLSDPANRAKFDDWAHQLWSTVNGSPDLNADPGKVAEVVFNHDKGYNRAFNFAQEAALASFMSAPPLADVVSRRPAPEANPSSQAAWIYQAFAEAEIIAADGSDRASQFAGLVDGNRTELESKLGPLDAQRVAAIRQELVDMVMLDDDLPAPSAPPADAAPGNHGTTSTAPWFEPRNPVSGQAIADARTTTPATSWVRGEDGGVLNTTTIGPNGINMQAWRGSIAYDNRVLDVNGVPVRDFTVRLHVDNADLRDRTRAGVEEMFNRGYRLPSGEQFHVTVEFTDDPADAHATINVTDDPDGRANQLTWPANTDSRRLAHEVGHFLGLRDEYLETGDVKPIFQHQDGRGRVVNDNSLMTAGIDHADASLKPRHLELIESRMAALQSHNPPQAVAVDSELPAPNMPKRERSESMEVDAPAKRHHEDLSPEVSDVDMTGTDVELVNEGGVHNAAFANLAGGRALTPITAENYLQRTKDGIANNEPPAFVVSMIVRANELHQLDDVVNGVMANAGDMNGRVAFVLGVNAASQQEIDAAMAAAAPTLNGRTEPIALVSAPHGPKGFKFGETRNSTLHSDAHEYAVTALAANGTHPYVSIMDFDAGDRRTREGAHVFDHVTQLMNAEEVGPADGPDTPAPLRPLLVGGGYRVAITPEQLHADVLARIDGDTKTSDAQKQLYRDKLGEEGFADRFVHLIDADMHARRNQQGIHPLLPYTPEPNLFFDALVPLADPSVRFGEGAAEFGQLASSLNRFHAVEIAGHYDPRTPEEKAGTVPTDQAKLAAAAEQVRVDVQNNRDPVRGQAFTADFVSGDTGTDLSRIAYGLIKDGKLPQSHTALPNVTERFFDGKPAKKGTAFADERERLSTGEQRIVEPFRPPADGQTTNTWQPPRKMETQLGAPARNRMSPAVSAPLPAPFHDQQAGVQKDQKVVAAHGIVASDHLNATLRQLRHLNTDVLRGQNPPPATDNGLYAAVGAATGVPAAALRLQAVELAAKSPAVAQAVADFTVSRPMHTGHMVGALVENLNWQMQPDAKENNGAGNARDLVGHLIATQQRVNVRIHQPGGTPVLLRPMGDAVSETVEIEMVMNGRQVTYRPYRRPQGLHQDEPML